MADIDDNELAELRRAAEFIRRASEVEGGEEAIEQLAKKINPKVKTTRDVAEKYSKPLEDKIEKYGEKIDRLYKTIDDYNESESVKKVKTQFGFTDEGMETLKKFKDERGIKNLDDAAIIWERNNPAVSSKPGYVGGDFTLAELSGTETNTKDEVDKLKANPQRYQDEQIKKFFDEKKRNSPYGN